MAQSWTASRAWWRRRSRSWVRGASVGIGTPWIHLARDGTPSRLELRMPQRQARPSRPRDGARTRNSDRQRRELLCALRSDRRRGQARAHGVRAPSSGPAWAQASWWAAASSSGATPSPANGATIRSRGPRTMSDRAPLAYCGREGCIETFVSGPGLVHDYFRATGQRRSAVDIDAGAAGGDAGCEQANEALRAASRTRAGAHHQRARPGRHRPGRRDVECVPASTTPFPRRGTQWVFSDRVDTALLRNAHGDSSGVRARCLAVAGRGLTRGASVSARMRGV